MCGEGEGMVGRVKEELVTVVLPLLSQAMD